MASSDPSLRCPQCGAPARPVEDDPFLSCPFCGAHLFLDAGGAVRHFIVQPRLDRAMAGAALVRWLKDREVVGAAGTVSSEMVFLPIWQLVIRGRTHLVPAAGTIYEGLDRLAIPAGDQRVFDAGIAKGPRGESARLIEAAVPLRAAAARVSSSRGRISSSESGNPDEERTRGEQGLEGVEARLIHVPLHLLAYQHNGAGYHAAVEASAGRVYPVTVPRSAENRIDAALAALLAGGLVANLLALSLIRSVPLLSVALLGLVWWALYGFGMKLATWMES